MSRTRIIGGKYTKITKGTHYMFSDENITTFSAKKIQEKGIENDILHGEANSYEPWKNKSALAFYQHHGFQITARSDVDGSGKPYPTLTLKLVK